MGIPAPFPNVVQVLSNSKIRHFTTSRTTIDDFVFFDDGGVVDIMAYSAWILWRIAHGPNSRDSRDIRDSRDPRD